MVVENPFGHLKGQQQSLLKQMDCYDIFNVLQMQ